MAHCYHHAFGIGEYHLFFDRSHHFGKIIKLAQDTNNKQEAGLPPASGTFMNAVLLLLGLSMGTAMMSRIAKNLRIILPM